MRARFESEGEIRGTDLLGALVALWRDGASGTLQFSRSGATAGFDIAAGDVVRTASSDPRFDTAAILVRAGKLDAPTLERLPVGDGADRAAIALQTGVLTRREWRWGEKIRAVEVLSDLLTWLEGEYWFFRTGAQEAAEFRLTIPRLVLELFLRSRDRNLVLHYLGGADVPLARAAAFDAEFPSFGLTADAESVVQLIDGERTAAEISSEAPSDAFAVEKLLAALVTLGLVHPEFAPGESPAVALPLRTDHVETPAPDADDKPLEDAEAEAEEASAGQVDRGDASAAEVDRREEDVAPEAPPEEEAPSDKYEYEFKTPVQDARPDAEPDRRPSDEAEAALAGGSFEEAVSADRYDGEFDDDEPEPADESEGGELELDGQVGSHRSIGEEHDAGADRDLGEEPVRLDSPASAPSDLLGFDGGAPPPSGIDRPLDMTTGVGTTERPLPRSGAVWLWVLASLAVAVIALLLWRSREGTGSSASGEAGARAATTRAETPTPVVLSATVAPAQAARMPSPTAMRIGPTARPTPLPRSGIGTPSARLVASPLARALIPTAPPPAVAAPARAASPSPAGRSARAPAPTMPSSPRPSAAAGAADSSRQTWVDRAERDRRRYVQEGKAKYAVQLELACELPSLADAFQHDRPAGSMWLIATPFQGRTCFRVLWGRYAGRDEASRGLSRAPAFFSSGRNHPAVVPIR